MTITVRDQRHREHDPILGVVPLRLSDVLQTSSQVTRWYPLDGGIVSTIWFLRSWGAKIFLGVWTRTYIVALQEH